MSFLCAFVLCTEHIGKRNQNEFGCIERSFSLEFQIKKASVFLMPRYVFSLFNITRCDEHGVGQDQSQGIKESSKQRNQDPRRMLAR